MFRRGQWVKLVHDLVRNGQVIEPAGAVGIAQQYHRVQQEGQDPVTVLEIHLVTFPEGHTRAIVALPDEGVEAVRQKSELPIDRVRHLPDTWNG